jgi:hypothetical protein
MPDPARSEFNVRDICTKYVPPALEHARWELRDRIAEQQRILVKVEKLMRWWDALEARLTAARTTATQLLGATLRQILNPAA